MFVCFYVICFCFCFSGSTPSTPQRHCRVTLFVSLCSFNGRLEDFLRLVGRGKLACSGILLEVRGRQEGGQEPSHGFLETNMQRASHLLSPLLPSTRGPGHGLFEAQELPVSTPGSSHPAANSHLADPTRRPLFPRLGKQQVSRKAVALPIHLVS